MRDATQYATQAGAAVPDDQLAAFAAVRHATVPLDITADTGGEYVFIHANHGRWVVGCPDCGGALLAHPGDQRFMCADCGNAGNEGRYRPVVWPRQYDRIAELLDARPDSRLRNWSPGESIADLRHENAVLGVAS